MHHIQSNSSKPAAAVLALLLTSLVLAACGGSSSSSSSASNASAAASSSTAGGFAPSVRGRFTAMRECLQKAGITLPKRTPGQGRPPGVGGFLGGGAGAGGPKLPPGVTRTQFEEALKKCGGGTFAGGRGRFDSPAFKQSLTKFVACMRENGVNLPTPNTSGSGPIFDTKGLDTSSAQFRAAEAKCRRVLAFARPAGAPGSGPAGAAPPGSAG
jgi:hypothetical protein